MSLRGPYAAGMLQPSVQGYIYGVSWQGHAVTNRHGLFEMLQQD